MIWESVEILFIYLQTFNVINNMYLVYDYESIFTYATYDVISYLFDRLGLVKS